MVNLTSSVYQNWRHDSCTWDSITILKTSETSDNSTGDTESNRQAFVESQNFPSNLLEKINHHSDFINFFEEDLTVGEEKVFVLQRTISTISTIKVTWFYNPRIPFYNHYNDPITYARYRLQPHFNKKKFTCVENWKEIADEFTSLKAYFYLLDIISGKHTDKKSLLNWLRNTIHQLPFLFEFELALAEFKDEPHSDLVVNKVALLFEKARIHIILDACALKGGRECIDYAIGVAEMLQAIYLVRIKKFAEKKKIPIDFSRFCDPTKELLEACIQKCQIEKSLPSQNPDGTNLLIFYSKKFTYASLLDVKKDSILQELTKSTEEILTDRKITARRLMRFYSKQLEQLNELKISELNQNLMHIISE